MNRVLRRSAINKENRAKLKIVHTSGARSFQRARALLKNPESDEISLRCFIKRRILIRMACGHQKMHEKILKKWKRYSCSTSQRESHTPKWRFREYRPLICPELEEARLQIEEMRARQLEYEALLVKGQIWSRRCKSITDDGGAATEERRRADADDGRAATKKRRRAPEDDGGAAKDPSGTTRTEDATNGGADA
ncbi:hypothetical protein CJ030_MR2G028939 [Morella rubra]|uniref:Uncharacterized protein n=1 Tax=Morella rubra TaxID=262757 RepID=A0A6A1WDL8_9ROSI|nr:hypothetical protein CJ030_MR2G028939 [Morella rubra]